MALELRYSASRVALIALVCSAGVFASVTALALPAPFGFSAHTHREMAYYLLLLAIGVVFGIVMYVALADFRRGITKDQWSQASLDALYEKIDRPTFNLITALVLVAIVFWIVADFASFTQHGHHHRMGAFTYFWISPITTLGAIKTALRPKPTHSGGSSIWTGVVKPLTSDHWGGR